MKQKNSLARSVTHMMYPPSSFHLLKYAAMLLFVIFCNKGRLHGQDIYVDAALGNDANVGTLVSPIQSLAEASQRINDLILSKFSSTNCDNLATTTYNNTTPIRLFLNTANPHTGQIHIRNLHPCLNAANANDANIGNATPQDANVEILPYGGGTTAQILAFPSTNYNISAAILVEGVGGVHIQNLDLQPADNAEVRYGVYFFGNYIAADLQNCSVEDSEIHSFDETGILVSSYNSFPTEATFGYDNIYIADCEIHNNPHYGISIEGNMRAYNENLTYPNSNVMIERCLTYDANGVFNTSPDPDAEKYSHSGVVLKVLGTQSGTIQRCVSCDNGDNNNGPSGPVGIWTCFSDGITIQHCESYNNKSMTRDGGGFDFDYSVTNSTLQYNYSHDNIGPGILIAQGYDCGMLAAGMPNINHNGNVIRYNVSQNDAQYAYVPGGENGLLPAVINVPQTDPLWPINGALLESASLYMWTAGVIPCESGDLDISVNNTQIYNNVFYRAHRGTEHDYPVFWIAGSSFYEVSLENNIFASTTENERLGYLTCTATDMVFEHNNYWRGGEAPLFFADEGCFAPSISFEDLQGQYNAGNANNFETSTMNNTPTFTLADPQLLDAGNAGTAYDGAGVQNLGNFENTLRDHLQNFYQIESTSLLRNNGTDTPLNLTDFFGTEVAQETMPEIGIHELLSCTPPLPDMQVSICPTDALFNLAQFIKDNNLPENGNWTLNGAPLTNLNINPAVSATYANQYVYTLEENGCTPNSFTLTFAVDAGCTAAFCDVGITYQLTTPKTLNGTAYNWNTATGDESLINADIIVPNGCTLTISGQTLNFGPLGRIVVQAGGNLIINGGSVLQSAGDCMWQGIRVEGNNGAAPFGSIFIQVATIRDALIGVALQGTPVYDWAQLDATLPLSSINNPDPLGNNNGGGQFNLGGSIALMSRAVFINCYKGIQAVGNIWLPTDVSEIYQSSFSHTGLFKYPFNYAASWGIGIQGLTVATLDIGGQNTFNNLRIAVDSYANRFLHVENSFFNDCQRGIYDRAFQGVAFENNEGAVIENNTFNRCTRSIYLQGQNGGIFGNTIDDNGNIGGDLGITLVGTDIQVENTNRINRQTQGLYCVNGAAHLNQVRNNEFSNSTSAAIRTYGDNSNMDIWCNNIQGYGGGIRATGTLKIQGDCAGLVDDNFVPLNVFGCHSNVLGNTLTCGVSFSDINSNTNAAFTYWYRDDENLPNNIPPIVTYPNEWVGSVTVAPCEPNLNPQDRCGRLPLLSEAQICNLPTLQEQVEGAAQQIVLSAPPPTVARAAHAGGLCARPPEQPPFGIALPQKRRIQHRPQHPQYLAGGFGGSSPA
ncbi:MAG: right-handed parallel beta-helix repeat-containing protein [Sphingobacteriales bacterium]|nr:right-handed parallel beta-helix repeat-containing protein [Sphingobacteriales bacterium]